jgi:hypothetical protein
MKAIKAFVALHSNTAVAAVFNDADNSAANFLARLMEQGIATRAEAEPFALLWASEKYGCPLSENQRGVGFNTSHAKYETSKSAKNRVLNRIFNDEIRESSAPKKVKFDAAKAAKQIKAKYTKAQLAAILALL